LWPGRADSGSALFKYRELAYLFKCLEISTSQTGLGSAEKKMFLGFHEKVLIFKIIKRKKVLRVKKFGNPCCR
jgi:hypothetical protein